MLNRINTSMGFMFVRAEMWSFCCCMCWCVRRGAAMRVSLWHPAAFGAQDSLHFVVQCTRRDLWHNRLLTCVHLPHCLSVCCNAIQYDPLRFIFASSDMHHIHTKHIQKSWPWNISHNEEHARGQRRCWQSLSMLLLWAACHRWANNLCANWSLCFTDRLYGSTARHSESLIRKTER